MTSGKQLYWYVPQFPHLWNGHNDDYGNKSIYLVGCLWEMNEVYIEVLGAAPYPESDLRKWAYDAFKECVQLLYMQE